MIIISFINYPIKMAFTCIFHVLIHLNRMGNHNPCFILLIISYILFLHACMRPTYWVEVLHMDTYILNILATTTLDNDTHYHKLFQKQPSYAHLRVFGCLCFPHIMTPHKLSPRSTPCVFLGYPSDHKGYRCLNLDTQKNYYLLQCCF